MQENERRLQMKKWLMVVVVTASVWAAPALAGQQKGPAVKPSTISGCVTRAGASYRLDHAIVATDPDVDTQNRPGTEASPTPKMISYTLTGADLKAHLGHKIEATGTISTDTKTKDTAEIKSVPGMKLVGTLNVTSVKMISPTCP